MVKLLTYIYLEKSIVITIGKTENPAKLDVHAFFIGTTFFKLASVFHGLSFK